MHKIKLTDNELYKLDNFLKTTVKPEERLTASEIHGLICGIVSSPNVIMPKHWMPLIIGSNPDFESIDEANEVMQIVTRINNAISYDLHNENDVDMPLLEDELIYNYNTASDQLISEWCSGYLRATTFEPLWNKDNSILLLPFAVLSGEFDLTKLIDNNSQAIEDDTEYKEQLRDELMDYIYDVFYFWEEKRLKKTFHRRASTKIKIRRNDPCSCGSGLKFKKCCYVGPKAVS